MHYEKELNYYKSFPAPSHSKQYENAALQELHIIHTLQVCYVC